MEGTVVANLSEMPLSSIIAYGIVIFIVLMMGMMFMKWLLTKSGVSSVGTLIIKREQEGQTAMYSMNEANKDTDDVMRQRLREGTNSMSNRILELFNAYKLCPMTRRSLAAALRYPLYESINNNHFTKELMPEKYNDYRQRILDQVHEEFVGVYLASKDISCSVDSLPDWLHSKRIIEQLIDTWLLNTCRAQKDCSLTKIDTYKKYSETFKENKDDFRNKIIDSCIAKNNHYIEEMAKRIIQLSSEIESREKLIGSIFSDA